MLYNYTKGIKSTIKKAVGENIIVYNTDEMLELLMAVNKGEKNAEDVICPFIVLNFITEYSAKENTYVSLIDENESIEKIDYTKELPISITTKVVIYAEEVKDIIALEDTINKAFSNRIMLRSDNSIQFSLELTNDEIIRDKTNKPTFNRILMFSSITFKSEGCIAELIEYHPAEVKFDKDIQKDLLKQIIALWDRIDNNNQRLEEIRPSWFVDLGFYKQLSRQMKHGTEKEKLDEKIAKTEQYVPSEEEKSIEDETRKIIPVRLKREMLLFNLNDSSALLEKLGINMKYYFREYLKEMEENQVDLDEAQKRFEKRKKEFDEKIDKEKRKKIDEEIKIKSEQQAKERREKLLEAKGDAVLNRFTDAVVNYFKELFKEEKISIFGGSTFTEWCKYDSADVPLPAMVIVDDANFTCKETIFKNCDLQGNQKAYYFNANAMLIYYGILLEFFAETNEELDAIESKIRGIFTTEKTIKVPDYFIQNEYNQIKLQIDSAVEPYNKSISNHTAEGIKIYHQRNIRFIRPVNVYPYTELSKDNLKYDQRLQFRTVQQLQYVTLMHSSLTDVAIRELKYTYKNLFTQSSTLGNVWNAYASLFKSADYREVSNCLKNRQPVNREKFDKVLDTITLVYPQLYDRTMQGWTVEQIEKDILNTAKPYKARMDELADLLDLPETVKTKRGNNYYARDNKALISYINYMIDDVFKTIDTAIDNYKKELNAMEDKKEEERRAREEAAMYEPQYSSDSSGGGILETAIGTAIGTHGIKKELKEANKRANAAPDLIGSSGCVIGKKNGSFTMSCNAIQCPLWEQCARGRYRR